jgi:hypothetical protein
LDFGDRIGNWEIFWWIGRILGNWEIFGFSNIHRSKFTRKKIGNWTYFVQLGGTFGELEIQNPNQIGNRTLENWRVWEGR